jgi:hypothetical protein
MRRHAGGEGWKLSVESDSWSDTRASRVQPTTAALLRVRAPNDTSILVPAGGRLASGKSCKYREWRLKRATIEGQFELDSGQLEMRAGMGSAKAQARDRKRRLSSSRALLRLDRFDESIRKKVRDSGQRSFCSAKRRLIDQGRTQLVEI